MPAHAILAVLPILPSLIGLLSLLPALLAGGLTFWRIKTETDDSRLSASVWRRFWLRQIPSLLVLFSLVLLGRYGWAKWIRDRTEPAKSIAAPVAEQWTMARATLDRAGKADKVALPRSAKVHRIWRFRPPGTTFYGDPLPVGDHLYVVGSRENVGTIYALSQNNGQLIWSCRPDNYQETISSPVAHNNILYVGEGLHYNRNSRLVAIALAGPLTGQVLWTFPVQGHLECAPVIDDHSIYLAAGDDGVYCLSIEHSMEKPVMIWHAPGDRVPDVDVSLAVHERKVFVGSGTHGNALLVLDAGSGGELERWSMPGPVRGLATLHGARIAYCSGEGDFKSLGNEPGQLTIRCLDRHEPCSVHTNCQRIQNIALPSIVLGAMAVANERLYLGCADGSVRCYGFDGTSHGHWNSGGPIAGSIVSDGKTIVVHNREGWIFGIDSRSLRPLWSHRLGSPGHYVSSPVAANGRIFIGTDDEGVICLGHEVE